MCPVKLREQRVEITAPDGVIQAIVIEPVGPPSGRGVLYYTDIFQLTESTLRTARQLASAGFLVCLPEIYPRELAGVALEFDDPGKQAGLAAAAATTTAQFDADCAAVLDYLEQRDDLDEIDAVGFCLGGHLAFRPRSTRGSRPPCASTRPACRTAPWAPTTRDPWPGPGSAAA